MKVYTMVYDEFAHFEVILTNLILKDPGETITVGIDANPVISEEGYKILPDVVIDDVDANDVDIFLVPGGDPKVLFDCQPFYDLLRELKHADKVVGAICSGPVHLAKAGLLENKKYTTTVDINNYNEFNTANFIDQNVVTDGNIITAKGAGYVDFGLEVGKVMNIYKDEEDYKIYVNFFKYFKV